WPPNTPVRVIRNSVTDAIGHRLMGHRPDLLPREVIAREEGRPLLRYSTDSPLRTTTGDLEAMAAYAGQSAALIDTLPTVAERIATIMDEARMALARLAALTGGPAT
ncbi:MAG: hypothetical protein JNJ84_17620, partial [Rhodobacteraceae bacterium]|nr:hypothetical protein [Paracoccaceae bacterium]